MIRYSLSLRLPSVIRATRENPLLTFSFVDYLEDGRESMLVTCVGSTVTQD